MSILVRFTPASPITAEQYDATIRALEEAGDFPPDGADYHCAFVVDGSIRVGEVWDSREKFEAFGERLMPLLADHGIDPGEPEILEVHNVIKP
jgi:hypothetical protein